jgi:diguanylate cyclase (GGDEF)-like protein
MLGERSDEISLAPAWTGSRAGSALVSRLGDLDRRAASARPTPRHAAGLGLAVAGFAVSLGLLLAGLSAAAGWVATASAGIAVGWGVTFAIARRTVDTPLELIADSMETLAARDVLALVDEFANLAQGDGPRPLEVHAVPVSLPSDGSVRRVAEALNATISRLQAGAYQFSAASDGPCKRLFYVGPDDYLLGSTCAEAMGSLLPNGGNILLLIPHFRHAGVELRRRGFESMLRERFPEIEVIGALENFYDNNRMAESIRSFIRTHPRLAGIYCTEATGVLGVIDALAGTDPAARPVVICHDTLDTTMAGISAGLISATVTQDPYGQGHDTAVHLFNAVAHGWRPAEPRLITASELITRDNYRKYWRPYEGAIESAATIGHRPKPLGPSPRHVRIAVLGLDDTPFWAPVRNGALAAAEELAACNASVRWIVPESDQGFDLSLRGPVIEALVRDGYDAIASILYSNDLLPYLNHAVDAGVVVATVNSESSSLQRLVATLSKQRKQLEIEATDLEVAAHHDALTGAYNRLLMDRDLEEVRTSVATTGKPATAVMIDIDRFKAYNDMYGHTAGDEVLRQVSRRIQRETRPIDRLYRYGGEEFLVVLRETSLQEGEAVAARIACGITTLGLTHEGNPPWGVVTVSAGVASVDPSRDAAGDCVADADAALYRSKRSGRNTVATYQGEPTPQTAPPAWLVDGYSG